MEAKAQIPSTQEVINGFFQSAAQLDAEAAASFFDEEPDYYIAKSPFMPWTGKRNKRPEVAVALKQLFDAHVPGEESFTIDHLFFDGQEAALFAVASRVVKDTRKKYSAKICMRFTVVDGLITRFLILEDSREIEKAFNKDTGYC
ncbi:nuclear transport factor 2 family protein [Mucilaginibacter celer]|nr:nuclear transport factor 2 family protein [Mucilaginibacter celer]